MIQLMDSRETVLGPDIRMVDHGYDGAVIELAHNLFIEADRPELVALAETINYAVEMIDKAAERHREWLEK